MIRMILAAAAFVAASAVAHAQTPNPDPAQQPQEARPRSVGSPSQGPQQIAVRSLDDGDRGRSGGVRLCRRREQPLDHGFRSLRPRRRSRIWIPRHRASTVNLEVARPMGQEEESWPDARLRPGSRRR